MTPHDPGGKSIFALPHGVRGEAYITPDEKHRIWLSRIWGPGARYALFIGMNPSTARADVDDPTIRREIGFAKQLGYDGLFKANIASYRATSPKDLLLPGVVKAHKDNLSTIVKLSSQCSIVILAWGSLHPTLRSLADEVIQELHRTLWCLGKTKGGDPRHPLYLNKATPIEVF